MRSFSDYFIYCCLCISPDLVSGGYETSVGMYFSPNAVFLVPDSGRARGSWVTWYSTIVTQDVALSAYDWFAMVGNCLCPEHLLSLNVHGRYRSTRVLIGLGWVNPFLTDDWLV